MPTWVVPAAVVTLSIAVLCLSLLPFIAALLHVTYSLDGTTLTAVVGALVGVITVIITNAKKNGNGSGENK